MAFLPIHLTGHYAINVDAKVKWHVIALGSCKPTGPFPIDDERRCFSKSYYTTTTKAGIKMTTYMAMLFGQGRLHVL